MAPPAHISRIDEIVYTYAKNYPQAIKVLRKELKKSPSVFCQIWIAELHSRLGQYVQAEEILLSLLEAKPTTIETNYLRRVYNAYALNKRRQGIIFLGAPSLVLDHFKAAEAIFLKSKVKVPSSRPMEIFFQCAYGSLALKDLVAACRELKKTRTDSDLHFLSAHLCQLASEACSSETFYAIALQRGATTEITKAFENTINEAQGPRITTPSHLNIALTVYTKLQQRDKLKEFFSKDGSGALSEAVHQGMQSYLSKKFKSLRDLGEWKAMVEYLADLMEVALKDAQGSKSDPSNKASLVTRVIFMMDQAEVFTQWAVAVRELSKQGDTSCQEAFDRTIYALGALPDWVPRLTSGPQLAKVVLSKSRQDDETFLGQCVQYFSNYCEDIMAVDDMRSIMTNVDIRSFLWKLYEMPLPYKGNRYKRRMNALFCEFILRTTEGNIPFTQEEADHFALRCIGWSETGAKPMAEACEPDYKNPIFLAAVALLSLPAENRRVRVIQAALLLTWTIDDEGKQPQQATRLLLVKVLLSLGLGDLAISIWHTLTIKNFVGDAMAHNMFSRISIQHPLAKPCEPYSGGPNKSLRVFRSAREKERTLTRELEASVQYYDRELDKDLLAKGRSLRKFVTDDSKLAVEQSSLPKNKSMGSLSGIIERLNLTLELDHSFSRAMVLLELRRINRMTGDRVVECQIPLGSPETIIDKRDFKLGSVVAPPGMPEMFPIPTHSEVDVMGNPIPRQAWLSAFLIVENTQSLIYGDRPLVLDCAAHEQYVSKHPEEYRSETTESEKAALALWSIVRRVAVQMSTPGESLNADWEELCAAADSQLPFFGKNLPKIYGNKALTALHSAAELVRSLSKLARKAGELHKDSKHAANKHLGAESIKKLSGVSAAAAKRIITYVREWKGTGRAVASTISEYEAAMKQDPLGERIAKRLENRLHVGSLASYLGQSSIASALEGVVKALEKV